MDDYQAYSIYTHHRKWFNKLWLAESLGYDCGPAGTAPTKDGLYIIRPTYNLSGMGAGAHVKEISAGDLTAVPLGYFWCEYITGTQRSADYKFVHAQNPYWRPISCWQGSNSQNNLTKFTEWKRSDYIPKVPRLFNELSDIGKINVEFIDDKPIEVHLRTSSDPDYDHIIPVWKSNPKPLQQDGYKFIESYDDADGYIDDPRIGFLVK